jgi:hypothetical protein
VAAVAIRAGDGPASTVTPNVDAARIAAAIHRLVMRRFIVIL